MQMVREAVRIAQLNNRPTLNHVAAKTRAEVSGGGKKPYKQKGTGRARVGSTRSPTRVGGGKAHGPHGSSGPRRVLKEASKTVAKFAVGSAVLDAVDAGVAAVVQVPRGADATSTSVVARWRSDTLRLLAQSHQRPLSLLSPFHPTDAPAVASALQQVGSTEEVVASPADAAPRAAWLEQRLGRRAPARAKRTAERQTEASVDTATGDRTRVLLVYGSADLAEAQVTDADADADADADDTSSSALYPLRRGAANIPTLNLTHARHLTVTSVLHAHTLWFTPAAVTELEQRIVAPVRRGPKATA